MSWRLLVCCVALAALLCSCGGTSEKGFRPDASIYNESTHIAAIDNHAHPSKLLAPGEQDVDADALPPDAISDLALPTPMLEGSPFRPEAWRGMFNVKASGPISRAQSEALRMKAGDLQRSKGDGYPAWVL